MLLGPVPAEMLPAVGWSAAMVTAGFKGFTKPLKVKLSNLKFVPDAAVVVRFITTVIVPVRLFTAFATLVVPRVVPLVGTVIAEATVVPFIVIEPILGPLVDDLCDQKLNEVIEQL